MGFDEKADQLKGKAKEAAGEVTDNEKLSNEGKADQLSGDVREKLEDAGEAVKDKFNEVAGKVQDKLDEDK
ncbi:MULTISPECIES: CsbD family protein [unclassified Corynebacterium]|uniref:CsbD family protein n=1 Tax=unclassified Corynebacterium TaxID=2624378 RepID=UPI0008A5104B|nr:MULTISPECIES: CsbD family protein [unclassified Corynebacterium]OFP37133.1 general stress protein CsbD [Corynebacterium sp. HMSC071B10]OHF40444.1 CsbD family protein [Corynebacterium sp. HMSC074A01]